MKRAELLLSNLCFILLMGLICLCAGTAAQNPPPAAHPYASAKPLTAPRIFAEGIISTGDYDSHPAFTPDGRTLYFLKSTPSFDLWTIVVSQFARGRWSEPQVAPFSGRYSDADPFITPDGRRLFFISRRPAPGKTADDLDIWVMEKTAAGWGEPRRLGPNVNSSSEEWFPTITADGTLYFGSGREGGRGKTDIYRCRLVDGQYGAAENLGEAINTEFHEYEPYIAPDESYLIFAADSRPDGVGRFDLYISYRRDGKWTQAANLGSKINTTATEFSPKVSHDGKYLFFTSTRGSDPASHGKQLSYRELITKIRRPRNGLGDIYQIELGALNIRR